ncbi:hypothetical protein, partial [Diaphorobacter ruginosibacter]|uniref:hypothetical protein n=1 Tax=Diaphorobacter ruginosibacter TaxID=1715720 RepID=UPI0033405F4E
GTARRCAEFFMGLHPNDDSRRHLHFAVTLVLEFSFRISSMTQGQRIRMAFGMAFNQAGNLP